MIHNIKLIAVLALITFGAGQAWARGGGNIKTGTVTGGTLTFYKEAACQNQIGIDNNLSSSDLTDGKVYIKATPSFDYTVANMELTAQESTGTGNAQARTLTRSGATDPGVGRTIEVSDVADAPGIYSFTMPTSGNNVLVEATFAAKPYLGDGTNAHISYYSYDAEGNRVTSNTGTDGHPRVYILDGTESELGQSGETVWYVSTTQTYNRCLTVLGTVGLILRDGTTMTVSHSSNATATISGTADASLTTYGQSAGTGRLAVSNAGGTAIGVGALNILGTGVAISSSARGISTSYNGTLRLAVLPTFGSGTAKNGCDISLSAGTVIDMVANITVAPQQRITVGFGEGYTAPFSFTNGYGAHCHYATGTKAGEVIAVGEMFASSTALEEYQTIVYGDGREYSSSDTYVPGEASLINIETISKGDGDFSGGNILIYASAVATVTNAKGTVEYFFGNPLQDCAPHFRGAVLAANAATSDVELKLCDYVDFENNDGVTFGNTHQVTDGAVTRPVAITLNLDVFTISGKNSYVLSILEGTSLTIMNTGNPGGLPIEDGVSNANAGIHADDDADAINNLGTLTIKGGQFRNTNGSIYNRGTVYVKGGLIYSHIQNEYDGIVYFSGGAINTEDVGIRNSSFGGSSPHVYVSGGLVSGYIHGIQNTGGAVTISGGTIAAGYKSGNISGTAIYSDGSLTFEALPTFNVVGTGSNDIYLGKDCIITFGSNFAVGSTFDKLKVCINKANGPDYTFTNGYSTRVKYAAGTDKAGQVIPPAEFFDAYYDDNNVALSSALRLTDGGEAELFEPLYSYVDATGTLHENVQAIVLDGSETSIGLSRTVSGSSEPIEAMYICTTPASENNGQGLVYENNLVLNENVPLIIADGCKLTVPGINGSGKTLTIYTQSGQTGQIVATTYGCNVNLAQRFVTYAPGATESDPMTATAIVSGNVTDLSAIAGKTLKPLGGYIVAVADGISLMDGTTAKTPDFTITTGEGTEAVTTPYYIYKASTEEAPVSVTLSYNGTGLAMLDGLPDGTTLDAVENQPMQRSFAMPATDVALTATAVGDLTASSTITYSGSAQTPAILLDESAFETTNYTVTGITPKEGTNSQLTDGSAVNAGEYSIAITGLGQYIGTTSVDFTIGKADYDGTTTVSTYVRSRNTTTDATLTLPALPEGASYASTGTVGGTNDALIDVSDGTPTVSGTTLTYSTTYQDDGASATITIPVTGATNYNDYEVVVTVTAKNKDDAGVSINGDKNIKTVTYGANDFTLVKAVTGEGTGTRVWTWTSTNTDVATIGESSGTITIKKAGSTTIRAVYESDTTMGESEITLIVNPKALSVTADNFTVSYGDPAPAYTVSYSGFVNDETSSVLSGTLSFTCSYTSSSNTGDYTITPSGLTSSNYNITFKNGTLTVAAKAVESENGTTVTLDGNGYSVTIDEGSGSSAVIDGSVLDANGEVTIYNLDYSRKLTHPTESNKDVTIGTTPAKLYTTCQPEGWEKETGVKYYTLSSVSGSTLHFSEIDGDPQADTPYLVAVTGNSNVTEHVTGNNVTLKKIVTGTPVDGYTMMGTQTGLTNSEAMNAAGTGNDTYILQDHDTWGKVVSGTVYIPAFRAFIVGPATSAGARELNSSFDGEAAGIDTLRLTDSDGTERWYDLNGRRIEKPTRKGVFIHGGRKEVIR